MRVYFLKAVPGVAQGDTIAEVKPGYARNFLFPRQLAVVVTPALEKRVQHAAATKTANQAKAVAADDKRLATLNGRSLVMVARASGDTLFGSVGVKELVTRIKEVFGLEVPAAALKLEAPLKHTGTHTVELVFGNATGSLTVEVRASA